MLKEAMECLTIGRSTVYQPIREGTLPAHKAGVIKHVGCHNFRDSFATHLLEGRYDIRTIQELPGHKDVSMTMIYAHVLNEGGHGVCSPVDGL